MQAPARWLYFFWLARQNRLLTNSFRARWSMESSTLFKLCGTWEERKLHALRDCPDVDSIWRAIIPFDLWGNFFGSDLLQWMDENLKGKDFPEIMGSCWERVFMAAIWRIWKRRCETVFSSDMRFLDGEQLLNVIEGSLRLGICS